MIRHRCFFSRSKALHEPNQNCSIESTFTKAFTLNQSNYDILKFKFSSHQLCEVRDFDLKKARDHILVTAGFRRTELNFPTEIQ